jgi:glutamine amidotransferase
MERCLIIDYGSGNLRSAAKACERAAAEADLSVVIDVTGDAAAIRRADRIILPGVGAFADCRRGLDAVPGLIDALEQRVRRDGVPFLGICVGMQLMAERGLEHRVTAGLGWIGGDVVALEGDALRIPHMGWNDLQVTGAHPVLAGIESGMHGYFVHSYRFACRQPSDVLASVDYGGPIAAVIGRDNLVGTQFHPEKSQATGLRLIGNFLKWRP